MGINKAFFGLLLLTLFGSCQDILEVPDISDQSVELLAPSDSTVVVQDSVQFNWNAVYEASQYHIQVASPNFENAAQILVDSLIAIDSTFTSPRIMKTLVNSQYEWRVKAMNSDYETGFSTNSFSVNASN